MYSKSKPLSSNRIFVVLVFPSFKGKLPNIRWFLRSLLLILRSRFLLSRFRLLLWALRQWSEQNFWSTRPKSFVPHSKQLRSAIPWSISRLQYRVFSANQPIHPRRIGTLPVYWPRDHYQNSGPTENRPPRDRTPGRRPWKDPPCQRLPWSDWPR